MSSIPLGGAVCRGRPVAGEGTDGDAVVAGRADVVEGGVEGGLGWVVSCDCRPTLVTVADGAETAGEPSGSIVARALRGRLCDLFAVRAILIISLLI